MSSLFISSCKRLISRGISPLLTSKNSTAIRFSQRRCLAESSDDNTSSTASTDEKKEKELEDKHRKEMLDVSEYYSQYIKEYEQGGFKDEESVQWERREEKLNISRGRGQTGVMDVDEIVEFLRAERIRDICTVRMPRSLAYAAHMVIGTPLGRRHMNAMTEKILKIYKKKRAVYDPPAVLIKDDKNPEWRAFDVGNVVIHLMTTTSRKRYDIEMLWAVGPENDDLVNEVSQLDEYSDRLRKIQEDIEGLAGNENVKDDDDARRTRV